MPLSPDERARLEQWAGGRDRRLARRASIVLGFADGEQAKALARRFRLSEPTAVKWRMRFDASRLAGLVDAPRSGAPRRILADDIERVIARMQGPPATGQSRWTTRTLARACGVSQTTVSRIWRANGIDPRAGHPPARVGEGDRADPARPGADQVHGHGKTQGGELARLASELAELRSTAPPEQVPFLRVALEALEAALSASTTLRVRAVRDGSRQVWARTEAAIAQARALVKEARARVAALQALNRTGESGGRSPHGPPDDA